MANKHTPTYNAREHGGAHVLEPIKQVIPFS